jgi:GNAT superfamily N-acetyltransferase
MPDPRDFRCTEVLKNGLAVTIRALRPDDREKMRKAVGELDRDSVYTRLFSYRSELTEAGLDRIMAFDPAREVVLVATIGTGAEEIVIGSGRYVVSGGTGARQTAELAFVVEEDYHGLGIAGRLFTHLAAIARDSGIAEFEAEVLAGNNPMLVVFTRSGLPMRRRLEGGIVHITLALQSDQA